MTTGLGLLVVLVLLPLLRRWLPPSAIAGAALWLDQRAKAAAAARVAKATKTAALMKEINEGKE
jgi:hypothetical protein